MFKIDAPGYHKGKNQKKVSVEFMRFEMSLQTGTKTQDEPRENLRLRIREAIPLSEGGAESEICLSIAQAEQLRAALNRTLDEDLPKR